MNLLPDTEKKDLKKGLKLRLLVVTLSLLSASFFVGSLMLIPAYVLSMGHFSALEKDNLAAKGSPAEDILNLPKEMSAKLQFLDSSNNQISVIAILSNIESGLRQGVVLNSISFDRNEKYKNKTGIHILASGLARDRESLVSFSNNLKESKMFQMVDIPVSSFTKDRDLPFSINIFIES